MERAGFWRRAVAAVIDALLGGVVVVVGAVGMAGLLVMADVPDPVIEYVGNIAVIVLALAYTSSEWWLAATPGKLATGLVIGTAAGTKAGRWTLALRWSSKYFGMFLGLISVITVGGPALAVSYLAGFMNTVVMVGCLQALDEHRRAWHDEWAGTAVLRRDRPSAPQACAMPPPLPPQAV